MFDAFSFKMSRNSDNITLTDSHAMLADESLNENHAVKFQQLTSKVDTLCKLLENQQASQGSQRRPKRNKSAKVHVPTRCRVSKNVSDACFALLVCLTWTSKVMHYSLNRRMPVHVGLEDRTRV